jgi:hypothetical protein
VFPTIPLPLTLCWDLSPPNDSGQSSLLFWLTRHPQTILYNWCISSSVSFVICLNQFIYTDGCSTFLLSLITCNHCLVQQPKVDHHTSVLLSWQYIICLNKYGRENFVYSCCKVRSDLLRTYWKLGPKTSGMWQHVIGYVVLDLFKDHNAFFLKSLVVQEE